MCAELSRFPLIRMEMSCSTARNMLTEVTRGTVDRCTSHLLCCICPARLLLEKPGTEFFPTGVLLCVCGLLYEWSVQSAGDSDTGFSCGLWCACSKQTPTETG